MRCVTEAWALHESELRRFLRHRVGNNAEADDLLQEVFLRALRRTNGLCGIGNRRAWLFLVARNLLIDRLRLSKEQVPLPDNLAAKIIEDLDPVDGLAQCLPRALSELSSADVEAISLCDIEGMSQQDFATQLNISLSAAKSRIQRARARLKTHLTEACQVRFDAAGQVCCFTPRPPA